MIAAISVIGLMIIIFIVIGIVFGNGKGSALIAGYNTLPKEEKAKYNEIEMTKFMGKMMYLLSAIMVLWIISIILNKDVLMFIGIALFIGVTLFIVIYMNTNKRFKR